jgi:hypothetical protein
VSLFQIVLGTRARDGASLTIRNSSIGRWRAWLVVGAVICAAGTWLYANRVLFPYQYGDAAFHNRPRGNFSDLYPRWVGARELLLHGRDPYTIEVTREIQVGFYGRVLGPVADGKGYAYQQGFYYPVYISFGLAPTLHLPFASVQKGFFRVLLGLTLVMIPLWLRVLRWSVPLWGQVALIILSIGTLPVMQGLKLQQITLVVAALLAAAMVLLVLDHQVPAGILLALGTIKPQLVWLVLFWLTIWTLGDWRRRYRWTTSFLLTMVILCGASEWYLPHWISRFWQAVREYRGYTGEMSVMDMEVGSPWSRVIELAALTAMIAVCWKERRQAANSEAFGFTVSLVLAITVLVVPSYGPYNQALLLPALLVMLKERFAIWHRSLVTRGLSAIVIGLLGWQWFWCAVLAGLSFVLPWETVERAHQVPLWTVLLTPFGVAVAMLVFGRQRIFDASGEPTAS